MQGLAFWTGYRQSLFPSHPLPEAAFVAQACGLIVGQFQGKLECEKLYRDIAGVTPPEPIGPLARCDLAIYPPEGKSQDRPDAIIEVKRASAPKALIDADLFRLAFLKQYHPNARAWLIAISQGAKPTRFVTKDGKSQPGRNPIPKTDFYFKVRRICKASATFKSQEKAHYVCLIEVLPK